MNTTSTLRHRVSRGLGWSAVGNLMTRLGNLLISILIARLLAPEQFGVFAVALTIWNILGTLAELGLGADLVRASDPARRAPTVASLGALTSGLLAGTMFVGAAPLAAAFRSPGSTGVVQLMSLTLVIFGLTIVPAALLQREYRQAALVTVNVTAMLVSAGVILILAARDHGPAALAWGQVAQQGVAVIGLHAAARSRPRFGFRLDVAQESLVFCIPLGMANMVSWLLITLDNVIVARGLSTAQLGLYVLAFNVSSWPMTAVGQSIRAVALPAFSGIAHAERRHAAFVRCSAPMATLAVLMALGLSTLADPIVRTLYGERWAAAATALVGLAVFGGIRVVLDLVATFLIAEGRTRDVLLVQVLWLCAMVPAMILAVARFGLQGAGWAHVVVAMLVVMPAYGVCLRAVGVDVLAFVAGWRRPLLTALPAAFVCSWIGTRQGSPLVLLIVGSTAVALLFVLPSLRWWLRTLQHLSQPQPEDEHLEVLSRVLR